MQEIVQYLLSKKAKTKKQLLMQCLFGLVLGTFIGVFKNKDYFIDKKCEEHLNRDKIELQARLEQKAFSVCGKMPLLSYFDCERMAMVKYKEEIAAQIQEEKKQEGFTDTLKEEVCLFLIGE